MRPETSDRQIEPVVAAGLTVFILVGTYFASQGQPHERDLDVWAVLLILVAGSALAMRRIHPVATLVVAFLAVLTTRPPTTPGGRSGSSSS